ncbi:MAG TPA: DUF4296 domain-containing protein [Bacteroidales bacterium]|nr:DUF4296 domain-containing protein [Bacteroidales bacterium]
MIRNIILLFAFLSMVIFSCSGRKNKADHRNTIPEKDLIPILTDMHIADGLLSLPKIRYLYSQKDSVSTYIDIIEKYGYTKEAMDKTMRFYFIRQPDQLIKIYDKVLGRLSEIESGLEKENPYEMPKEINLWPGKNHYSHSPFSPADSVWFEVPVKHTGIYSFRFTLTIYPDDESFNPRTGVFLSHPDSTRTGKRDYFSTIAFIKDGRRHTYIMTKNITDTSRLSLNGWFIDYENLPANLGKHSRIEKISLLSGRIE